MPEFDLRVIFFTIGQNIEIRLVKALYNLRNVCHAKGIDCRHLTSFYQIVRVPEVDLCDRKMICAPFLL